MTGNWLQDALNWYWITPWQLFGLIVLIGMIAGVLFSRIGRSK